MGNGLGELGRFGADPKNILLVNTDTWQEVHIYVVLANFSNSVVRIWVLGVG
jgi:hypothetical protein